MSYADIRFIENCRDILENGVWDTDREVRPHWEDGTPAHTVKKFGIVNRYNLREEFPILTLRRTYWKTAVDELLWIWQKKSNNVHDLNAKIWDEWADETGSIGKAYGYQLSVKHHYPEGDMDQVDRVLYDLKHNPASRRIMTNIYNFQDLSEMHLYPCAYSMTFNVSGNVLNAILNQRSQDMLAANNWNVVQYAVLVHMMAQVSGLVPGELVHVIADAHIYDRHVSIVEKIIERMTENNIKAILKDYPENQIIIFSNSRLYLCRLQEVLQEQYKVERITGDITLKARMQAVDNFQTDKTQVLCIQTQAGKEGLTLDNADAAIFADTFPPAADYQQARDRIVATDPTHVKPKEIIHLMMKGTYDAALYDTVARNIEFNDIVNDYKNYIKRRDTHGNS